MSTLKNNITSIIAIIVWTYVIIRYQTVRSVIVGIFKWVYYIWAGGLAFIVGILLIMTVISVLGFVGIGLGVIDKDKLKKLIK